MAIEVRTLKQFLESDHVIDCDCSNYWVCTHTGPFKLEMAIQRLGWEFDFYSGRQILAMRTYCSVCGKRQPTFRLGWKDKPSTYSGTHGAGLEMKPVAEMRKHAIKWIEGSEWRQGGETVRKFGPGK